MGGHYSTGMGICAEKEEPKRVEKDAEPEKPFDVMAVVTIKDLAGSKHLFRVSRPCQNNTSIAQLTQLVETELSKRCPIADNQFSESAVKITAMVQVDANDWPDVCQPEETLGVIADKW